MSLSLCLPASSLLLPCPSVMCIVFQLVTFLTAWALNDTMVGGVPSENLYDAVIALECLEPGFEVSHPGGLLDSISQAELICIV